MTKKKKRSFVFRTPHFYNGIDANEVAEELERIKRNEESLTPALVVEHAKDQMSSLHACFEWDDSKAAHKHRLHQASSLILNIQIVHKSSEPKIFLVQIEDSHGKKTYEDVDLVTEEAACLVMENALKDLRAWTKRYSELRDRLPLQKVFSAVDKTLEERAVI